MRADRGGRERDMGSSRPPMGDEDMRQRSRYPDTQQLFVGNLPHTISEEELTSYFESKLDLLLRNCGLLDSLKVTFRRGTKNNNAELISYVCSCYQHKHAFVTKHKIMHS